MSRSRPPPPSTPAARAADLIVLGDRLDRVGESWQLARVARRRILENFAFAFGYNVITVPLAVAGQVTPLIAAIAMSVELARRLPERAEARPVNILAILIPASLFLGLLGLAGFLWALRTNQYDDPEGRRRAHPLRPLRRPPRRRRRQVTAARSR